MACDDARRDDRAGSADGRLRQRHWRTSGYRGRGAGTDHCELQRYGLDVPVSSQLATVPYLE
jgi:hypothetical protein